MPTAGALAYGPLARTRTFLFCDWEHCEFRVALVARVDTLRRQQRQQEPHTHTHTHTHTHINERGGEAEREN